MFNSINTMKSIQYLFLSFLLTTGLAYAESAAMGDGEGDTNQQTDGQRPPNAEGHRAKGPPADGQRPKGPRPDNRPSKEEILAKFDVDGDGKLNESEKKAAKEARQEQMVLRRFDADGDGQLSSEERAQADAFRAEREAKMLAKFDTDGDGILSDEERQAARQKMSRKVKDGQAERQGPNDRRQGPPRSDELPAGAPPPPPPGE
ncbi:hypothetical protein GCM10007047_17920 [Cerasicoccus arenae]|uniref:EF-hand domain-containing protein n=2 Tax=Cerasicoccus arenae TaxID=424488 RepID=A0A8J3DFU5_9BACT|nr:hypothetical protein GCM10007047_17920 [Cerasicoccus arenae]